MMIRSLLFFLSILIHSQIFAAEHSYEFSPWLSIPVNSQHSIEIKTEETFFYSHFSYREKKLADINMPFKVVSSYDKTFYYKLFQHSVHHCSVVELDGTVTKTEFKELFKEEIKVDLTEPNSANWEDSIEIQARSENKHVVRLTFPETPPFGKSKDCEGFVSIQLELAII